MFDFLSYSFMQNALVGALFASILTSVIGAIIIERKMVMLTGGISHTSFGGIGLGYLLGFEPIIGGYLFAILASLAIPSVQKKTRTDLDSITGMMWSFGMALGILFIYITPGYPPDMTSYLFGNILTISDVDLQMMGLVTLAMIAILLPFYQSWKLFIFDPEFAKIIKKPVALLEYTLYILIAISIVALLKVVGIILVITLLVVPASISKLFTRSFESLVGLAMIISIFLTTLGLYLSYLLNIPSGASIIFFSVAGYALAALIKKILSMRKPLT